MPSSPSPKATHAWPNPAAERRATRNPAAVRRATRNPDDVRDDYWASQVAAIAVDPDKVTDEEWPKIRDAVLGDLGVDVIPF